VNLSPVLALAGLAAIGLLVTRLPLPARRRVPWLDPVLAAGGPLVLLGIILGPGAVPGIGFLDGSVLRSLAPVTALAIGWIGAGLGARFEWRSVRRISRRAWLLAALPSGAAFGAVALGAWMLTRALPAVAAAWTPRLAAILMLAAVAAVSGPGVVALVAREAGLRRSTARGLVLAASLETLVGALLFFVPVALHRGDGLTTIAFAVGSTALVGVAFLSLMRVWPAGADIGFAVLATLAFGAGVGYATGLSPFVVCALAAAVIVHASPPARRAGGAIKEKESHPQRDRHVSRGDRAEPDVRGGGGRGGEGDRREREGANSGANGRPLRGRTGGRKERYRKQDPGGRKRQEGPGDHQQQRDDGSLPFSEHAADRVPPGGRRRMHDHSRGQGADHERR